LALLEGAAAAGDFLFYGGSTRILAPAIVVPSSLSASDAWSGDS